MKGPIKILISLGILFAPVSSESCNGFSSIDGKTGLPPKIRISNLPKEKFSERDNDIIINGAQIHHLRLDCWAPYPIDLTFQGHVTNKWAQIRAQVGPCFHLNITIPTYKEITGNYSCFSIQRKSLQSSKYIFVETLPISQFLRHAENVSIHLGPNAKKLILPCATSSPNTFAEVKLFKKEKDIWSWVLPGPFLLYDPKLGFVLSWKEQSIQLPAEYKCENSPQDWVHITVGPQSDEITYPPSTRLHFRRGDNLEIKCLSRKEEVRIKILDGNLYQRRVTFSNGSSSILQGFKGETGVWHLDGNNISDVGHAECVRMRDDFVLKKWTYTVRNEQRPPGILDIPEFQNNCPNNDPATISFFECHNWVACKMSRCLRKDQNCISDTPNCLHSLCIDNGLIQCPSEESSNYLIFFSGLQNRTRKYTNWKAAEKEDILRIQVRDDEDKKSVLLSCEGTAFVLASGFRWVLDDENPQNFSVIETWGENKAIIMSVLHIPKDLILNYTNITCSASIFNSTERISQTLSVMDDVVPNLRKDRMESNSGGKVVNIFSLFCVSFVYLEFIK